MNYNLIDEQKSEKQNLKDNQTTKRSYNPLPFTPTPTHPPAPLPLSSPPPSSFTQNPLIKIKITSIQLSLVNIREY